MYWLTPQPSTGYISLMRLRPGSTGFPGFALAGAKRVDLDDRNAKRRGLSRWLPGTLSSNTWSCLVGEGSLVFERANDILMGDILNKWLVDRHFAVDNVHPRVIPIEIHPRIRD